VVGLQGARRHEGRCQQDQVARRVVGPVVVLEAVHPREREQSLRGVRQPAIQRVPRGEPATDDRRLDRWPRARAAQPPDLGVGAELRLQPLGGLSLDVQRQRDGEAGRPREHAERYRGRREQVALDEFSGGVRAGVRAGGDRLIREVSADVLREPAQRRVSSLAVGVHRRPQSPPELVVEPRRRCPGFRQAASDDLVKDDADRVDVGARVDVGRARALLRAHVARRAGMGRRSAFRPRGRPGDAEVDHLRHGDALG
jgi:hypothetical protein